MLPVRYACAVARASKADSIRSYNVAYRNRVTNEADHTHQPDSQFAHRNARAPASIFHSGASADNDGNTAPWRSAPCRSHQRDTPVRESHTRARASIAHDGGPADSDAGSNPRCAPRDDSGALDMIRACDRTYSTYLASGSVIAYFTEPLQLSCHICNASSLCSPATIQQNSIYCPPTIYRLHMIQCFNSYTQSRICHSYHN
jgi:hypothetical protein